MGWIYQDGERSKSVPQQGQFLMSYLATNQPKQNVIFNNGTHSNHDIGEQSDADGFAGIDFPQLVNKGSFARSGKIIY